MINILHAIDTSGPGGAETVFLNIIENLNPGNFRSFIALSGTGWLYERLLEKGFSPLIIDSKGAFNFKYLWNLIKSVKKHKIQVIHSHLLGSNVYCSLVGLILKIPVISTFHGYVDANRHDRLLHFKFRIIKSGSKKIIFVSEHLKRYFSNYTKLNPEQAEVIYNGVDTSRFKPQKNSLLKKELGLKEKDALIGSIGNIRAPKGYDILLRAAARVRDVRNDCKFVIAGEGSGPLYDELLALQKKLHLQDTVFFLGFRDDPEFLLNNFDIFLLPSISEGFSISTIEAMACMAPVVATRSGGPEEIIVHNQNGILIMPGKPDIIETALLNLITDKQKMEQLSNAAFNEVRHKFSNDILIENYENLYENCPNLSNRQSKKLKYHI